MSRKRKKPLHQHPAESSGFDPTALMTSFESIHPSRSVMVKNTTDDRHVKRLEFQPKLKIFQSGNSLVITADFLNGGKRDKLKFQSRGVIPSRMAYLVSSATPWRSSFLMICWRWVSTVFALRPREKAISLVHRPSAISCRTSRSLFERSAFSGDFDSGSRFT